MDMPRRSTRADDDRGWPDASRLLRVAFLLLVCAPLFSGIALAACTIPPSGPECGDYGDAPEGEVAYPALGVVGNFPTCLGGANGFARHAYNFPGNPNMWFGPSVDYEDDGNQASCFVLPYDQDECRVNDGDSGLLFPEPLTLVNGLEVPCGPSPTTAVGAACSVVFLGTGLDLEVHNTTSFAGVVNILFDWDQNGEWGGGSLCASGTAMEHAVVNLPVPPGFSGPLSGLGAGPVMIGPNPGYVWMRVSIAPDANAPPLDWDGSGIWEVGETEDYLMEIVATGADLGDAPEDDIAYPSGVIGEFPTCKTVGPAGFVEHLNPGNAYFGASVDLELDGNAGNCPQLDPDYDECDMGGGDAGLLLPEPWTIVGGVERPCPNVGGGLFWDSCHLIQWGLDLDIEVTNNSADDLVVNMMADWNQDGRWTPHAVQCPGGLAFERVLADFPVPSGFSGPLSQLQPPDFFAGGPEGWVWCRFTISETGVALPDWDGSGSFQEGETEDYMIMLHEEPLGIQDAAPVSLGAGGLQIVDVHPNPFNPRADFELDVAQSGAAQVTIYDEEGRQVRQLLAGHLDEGRHRFQWDGTSDDGQAATSGIYFLRAQVGTERAVEKLVLVR